MRMPHKSIPKLFQQISFHRKYVTITIKKYKDLLKFTSVLEQKYVAEFVCGSNVSELEQQAYLTSHSFIKYVT